MPQILFTLFNNVTGQNYGFLEINVENLMMILEI